MTFFAILKKNFEILFNLKLSSLILVFGPIFLILVMGIALGDTSIKNLDAGVYSASQGKIYQPFINDMSEKGFKVTKEVNLESCNRKILDNQKHACLDLIKVDDYRGYEMYDVVLYVDFSKQRLVWKIIGAVQEVTDSYSRQARSVVMKDLKNDIQVVIYESNQIEDDMNELEREIDLSIQRLEQANQDQIELQDSISYTRNQISSISYDLEKIKLSSNSSQHISLINNVKYKLSQIDSQLAQANSQVWSNLNSGKSNVVQAKESLSRVKSSFYEIRSGLQRINEIEEDRLIEPFQMRYDSVTSNQEGNVQGRLEYLDYLFPSFLALFIMFVCMITSTILVVRERSTGAYVRNIASRVGGIKNVTSIFLTSFLISFIQVFIVVLIASSFLNFSLLNNLFFFAFLILISISVFILIGILLGFIFDSYESSITAAIVLILFSLVFSSIITPAETLPKFISILTNLLPLTLIETKLRMILLLDNSLRIFPLEFFSFIFFLCVSIGFIALSYILKKEKEI